MEVGQATWMQFLLVIGRSLVALTHLESSRRSAEEESVSHHTSRVCTPEPHEEEH